MRDDIFAQNTLQQNDPMYFASGEADRDDLALDTVSAVGDWKGFFVGIILLVTFALIFSSM